MLEGLGKRMDLPKLTVNSVKGEPGGILWQHQSYDQPTAIEALKYDWDEIVFVSHWQASMYRTIHEVEGRVIYNACEPVPVRHRYGPMKCIYTSTPFRGLDVLLDAWELADPADAELHIYSGMALYGRPDPYGDLYDKARSLPNVHYRGVVSNKDIRSRLGQMDIMLYPSTFEETSCLSVIEALSAGLKVICPGLGALPETCGGWATLYDFHTDKREHVQELLKAMEGMRRKDRPQQREWANRTYSWERAVKAWSEF